MQTIIPASQEILSRIGVEHRPEDAIKVAVQRYRRLAHSNSMMDDFSLLLQKIVSIISRVAALTLDGKFGMMVLNTYLVGPLPGVLTMSTHPGMVYCSFNYDHGDIIQYPAKISSFVSSASKSQIEKSILIKILNAYLLSFAF